MDDSVTDRLTKWLADHDDCLARFAQPIALSTVARETGIAPNSIRETLATGERAIYHMWSHTHAGRKRPNKPYCLRFAGPDALCLDWEDSVVGAVEAEFIRRGYTTCRELGTDEHIQGLLGNPDLTQMKAGVNLRDLWALRRECEFIDLWIVEAKGKEAGGFDRYCFAEALGQLFEIPAEPLTALLGSRCKQSHGLCVKLANRLLEGWQAQGRHARVTLAVLVPRWSPDVIWTGATASCRIQPYYQRAWDELAEFIEHGKSHSHSIKKGEAAYGQILEGLESTCSIRSLSRSQTGLCFRALATCADPATGEFTLRELPAC